MEKKAPQRTSQQLEERAGEVLRSEKATAIAAPSKEPRSARNASGRANRMEQRKSGGIIRIILRTPKRLFREVNSEEFRSTPPVRNAQGPQKKTEVTSKYYAHG